MKVSTVDSLITQEETIPFSKFLTPPVSNCLQCDKSLSMHNDLSRANLLTHEGPIMCAKISLECKDCSIEYGIANFSDELGAHFYPQEFVINVVEVSNVTYIDMKLYNWIPSLR